MHPDEMATGAGVGAHCQEMFSGAGINRGQGITVGMAEVKVTDQAVGPLADAGATIARAEGFIWHAKSMEARKRD